MTVHPGLWDRIRDLEAIVEVQQASMELLTMHGDLEHAHVENLIERMHDLETWLERHNIDYRNHLYRNCTCGWGGQHDPDNQRCDMNKMHHERQQADDPGTHQAQG
jgi:hypothetical protein